MDGLDQLRVSFPADQGFGRVGRVAVAGLALRLGFDVATVERLRLAVDAAVAELSGSGRITLVAAWDAAMLVLELSNPEVQLDPQRQDRVRAHLGGWFEQPEVASDRLRLVVPAG